MAVMVKDIVIGDDLPKTLLLEKHISFIKNYGNNEEDNYEYRMTDYLRVSGMYWGLTALDLLNRLDELPRDEVVKIIVACQDSESGGISACPGHDPHLLHTLSALQILAMYDRIDCINAECVVSYVRSLQDKETGAFAGDRWGEIDTRFSFCALMCLSLLNRISAIDMERAIHFVDSCKNFDGGYGSRPQSESHAGLVYCCVGFFSLAGRLDMVERDTLAWWLCERQLESGGLNGRPEKMPDICYSWWVLASLRILGRMHWIDLAKLRTFIMACQDVETGGFSDRPGDVSDPYHTMFGLAALALMDHEPDSTAGEDGISSEDHPEDAGDATAAVSRPPDFQAVRPVNPTYCMVQDVIDRLHLKPEILDRNE